ncbi:MAG: hypothetical protein JXR63_08820, partial [Spirochaetales bacterium]|nr:hypothetical protein [Spirochaetales bacterium]
KVLKIIRQCSLQNQTSRINYEYFTDFLSKRVTSPPEQVALDKLLNALAEKNQVTLDIHGAKIKTIIYPNFFIEKIEQIYNQMSEDPGIPFPTDAVFKEPLPEMLVQKINVKSEFVSYLENPDQSGKPLLKLMFPNFDHPLIAIPVQLKRRLLISAVEKIKFYLSREQNMDYIRTRMMSAFKGEENAVKLIMANLSKPAEEVAQTIIEPNSFSFKFWTHIASSIVKEYQSKKTLYGDDFMPAQASYLIGFYNVYYKGVSQREQSVEASLNILDNLLSKEPYCFSVREMYNFRDPKDDVEIVKKCGKKAFNDRLTELMQLQEGETLPRLILVKVEKNKEVFIARDVLVLYFFKLLSQTEPLLKSSLYEDWKRTFESYSKLPEMKNDELFRKVINSKVKAINPVLYALLNYQLLSNFRSSDKLRERERIELDLLLDDNAAQLKPLEEIFKINRKALLYEVKSDLPLTKSSGFVRAVVVFFAKALGIFSSMKDRESRESRKHKKVDMEFTKTSNNDFSNAIKDLKETFLGGNVDDKQIEYTLDDLIEKWNPLIDNIAKENLVEDVNSMIRDYIRKMKRSFIVSAPDKDRVESMAMRLSRNSVFDSIKNKDALQRYMEIYMIKIVANLKLMK